MPIDRLSHCRFSIYARATLAGMIVTVAGACQKSPFAIDRDLDRLLDQTDQKTGSGNAAEVASPRSRASDPTSIRRQGQGTTAPPTVNPAADDLTFVAADEARDVAARLNRYAADAGVPTSEQVNPDTGDGVTAPVPPRPARVLTLEESFRVSQVTGRELLSAQDDYLLAAIRLLVERHLWGPRLFNDTSVEVFGQGDDARYDSAARLINTLRVNQRLPYGGAVEAAWVWDATEQLRESATDRYTQSSELVFSGNIPLLRGAGDIAREDLIQAERSLIYQSRDFERFRRSYLVSIANDYFELLQTRATIFNQERQLESLRQLDRSTRARVEAGRLDAFQTGVTASRVKAAEASLSGLRESYQLQLERFKIRLGVGVDERLDLSEGVLELPEPQISLDDATAVALEFRLDLQNERDRLDDARRRVANARNGLLPDLDLTGRIGVPTDPDRRRGNASFSPGDANYSAGATLSLPLDRRQEALNVRASVIEFERRSREFDRQRDTVIVGVRSSLRSVELARFQLALAEQQVEINRRRLAGQRLRADTVQPQDIVDSENELLRSENDRDQARTNLRNAVLNYLLESDQLRVNRDGTLRRLPGM